MKTVFWISILAVIVVGGIGLLNCQQKRSLRAAEQVQLLATFDRWVEAGQPYGEALSTFMNGRGEDFLVDTQRFEVSGTFYFGILARTNLLSESRGRFVITTNRVLLWVDNNGTAKIARQRFGRESGD